MTPHVKLYCNHLSKPYYDAGGGEAWMIAYSIPLYFQGKQPQLIGVLTSDLIVPNE